MDVNQISPYIRVATDSRLSADWQLRERVIFDYELLYVMEGEIAVTVEDQVYRGVPGDVFLFKPRQRHSIRVVGEADLRQPHLHFDLFQAPDSPEVKVSFKPLEELSPQELGWFREDRCSRPPFDLPNRIRLRNPLVLEKMLFDIIHEYNMGLPYAPFSIKGLFIQLWTFLLRENEWSANPRAHSNWEQLIRVKHYMNHHSDEDVTLAKLASIANMSKYYFIRVFKSAFGISPMKYQQIVRMEKAKELIQYTPLSLTEIAERFGFESIHAFSRAFKRLEGVPPSFYRSRSAGTKKKSALPDTYGREGDKQSLRNAEEPALKAD